eukprot:Ihof_evm11s31 gene=Ihof_evmTU11s31
MEKQEAKPLRVLVAGDVGGHFNKLYNKVTNIQKKVGTFDLLLCTGAFFSEDESESVDEWNNILSGDYIVPIPTYVLGGTVRHHAAHYQSVIEGGDLAANVHYLGRKGVFKTVEGLTIGFLSGVFEENAYKSTLKDELRPYYTKHDVDALLAYADSAEFKGIDVLLTSEWPKGITTLSTHAVPSRNPDAPMLSAAIQAIGSDCVSLVAKALIPRYHFSGMQGVFYEREPYRNHIMLQSKPMHVTRFIALADIPATTKMKSIYAFNITPMSTCNQAELTVQPPGITACPLAGPKTVAASQGGSLVGNDGNFSYFFGASGAKGAGGRRKNQPGAGYVCRLCNITGHYIEDCPTNPTPPANKRKTSNDTPPEGYVCRQCNISGHWISDCPMVMRDEMKRRKLDHRKAETSMECWFCLSSPQVEKHLVVTVGTEIYMALAKGPLVENHILLLPINHLPSSRDLSASALAELERYKGALVSFYASQGQACVFFERNIASRHMQIQVIPVPKAFDCNLIKEIFKQQGDVIKAPFVAATDDVMETVDGQTQYMLVEFSDMSKIIYVKQGDGIRFPLQFG